VRWRCWRRVWAASTDDETPVQWHLRRNAGVTGRLGGTGNARSSCAHVIQACAERCWCQSPLPRVPVSKAIPSPGTTGQGSRIAAACASYSASASASASGRRQLAARLHGLPNPQQPCSLTRKRTLSSRILLNCRHHIRPPPPALLSVPCPCTRAHRRLQAAGCVAGRRACGNAEARSQYWLQLSCARFTRCSLHALLQPSNLTVRK
jgi:hypothetical protein